MKKLLFFVISGFLLVSSFVFPQPRPLMGYDGVPFGASVEDVRRAFNLEERIALRVDHFDSNIALLRQDNVSESIEARVFIFIRYRENAFRLYQVLVLYADTSDGTARGLENQLTNTFGGRTDYAVSIEQSSIMFYSVEYTEEVFTFGRYYPDLVVELSHRVVSEGGVRDTDNNFGQNMLRVSYRWEGLYLDYRGSR